MSKVVNESEGPKGQEQRKTSDEQIETLEKVLETERKRSEEHLTQLKYARADIENLKRRFDRQLEDARIYANEHIIIQLLDVVDELEMAVKSSSSCDSAGPLVQGVELTLKKLTKILEHEEVFPIKSVGEPFNPEKHNAVARIEKEGIEGCLITEEVRRGYTMRGKVIRPTMVKVVVPSSELHEETKGDEFK